MRGPIFFKCIECGGKTKVTQYKEFVNCYACGTKITFTEKIKTMLKERFKGRPVDAGLRDDSYEMKIFSSLGISREDGKYIHVEEDTVYFVFPIAAYFQVSVGGAELKLNEESMHEQIEMTLAGNLSEFRRQYPKYRNRRDYKCSALSVLQRL
ncbi:MAG: hypothetical protein HY753_01815 [Nitrospirae bacterium]|nr:hypothetical protein [Nitrospirota bacterium]